MRPLVILLLLFPFVSISQSTFSEEELIAVVKKFHPIAKAAAIDIDMANANLLSNRAPFDPAVKWNNSQKTFDGIDYYNRGLGELKIPTWYGLDFYAGTENISGNRTNPEETKGKLSYIGVSLPLVQNMVLDKRRAAWRTAKLLVNQTEMQRRTAVNQLVADALQAYWNWWQHFNSVRLVDSSLSNAQKRFTMVKTAFILGDRPAIDTIEALAQVQTFALQKTEVEMQLQKSSIELSGFLWKEDNQSYQLSEEIVPAPKAMMDISLDDLLQKGNLHPELLTYKYKLNSLQIEKKLKFQSLLPDIDVKYQYLSKGYNPTKNLGTSFFENNYRFALSFSMPLRLSEGRGEFQKAKLKIKQTTLQQLDKSTQIQNKIKQYFTEWQQTSKQLTTQQNIISNYFLLQTGEETRFFNGESSLFLVNSREQKTLEAKQKQIELQSKRYKAFTNLLWSAGVFGN